MTPVAEVSPVEFRLLNEFQRNFPLVPAPWAALAAALGIAERDVQDALARWSARGVVSRVGAVFRPGVARSSTLAAMALPAADLAAAARIVNAFPEVSHNYERENRWNLWFVVAATDTFRLDAVLRQIEARVGTPVLRLPLVEEYHVDLGFPLGREDPGNRRAVATFDRPPPLSSDEEPLVAALEAGLPLVPRPFALVGAACGFDERRVIATLERWLAEGTLRRFGVVLRHRELGYGANAMSVWKVPDGEVREAGLRLACEPRVTLAYRRAESLPAWPYNLYCMVHGRERSEVTATLADLARRAGLERHPQAVLFSRQCFKQTGARSTRREESWMPSIA